MAKSTNQIVVLHMDGCPHCRTYLPKFKRVAVKFRAFISIKDGNVDRDPKALKVAEQFKINGFPVTLVLDQKDKLLKKYEGSLDAAKIKEIFDFALK
jgi:thiol-disulfide isomerase/thioredoxin